MTEFPDQVARLSVLVQATIGRDKALRILHDDPTNGPVMEARDFYEAQLNRLRESPDPPSKWPEQIAGKWKKSA